MIKYIFILLIINAIVVLNSCKTTPTSPESKPPVLSDTIPSGDDVYHQIKINQTDYQSFEISNKDNFILNFKKISSIILGNKQQGIFYAIDSSTALYEQVGDNVRLKFNFFHNTDDTTLLFNFTIRYVLIDSSIFDLDSSTVTYKWPYKSTEIFIKWSKILIPPEIDIQDFEILDSTIYFHPYGSAGMYQYDIKNPHTTLKKDYVGGDYLAVSQNYVFCDFDHHQVGRFDIASESINLAKILIPYDQQTEINGMDVYENKLYVVIEYKNIVIYNFDLQPLDSIPYANYNVWLAIKDSIAYSNNWSEIVRFNLITQNYIKSVKYPTSNCEAISIIGDKMYFTDYKKKIIAYFNLSEL